MGNIYIVGIGLTPFGRFPDLTVKSLTVRAVQTTLQDAGCDMSQIEAAWFSNSAQGAIEGQNSVRGQIALRSMGFEEIPIVNIENACASGSTAFNQACVYLRAGCAETVLAIGCEKMTGADKERGFAAFLGGLDVNDPPKIQDIFDGDDLTDAPAPGAGPHTIFMDIYAAMARAHMKRYGSTQRQMAAVSSKNHAHSAMNPFSQYQKPFSVDEVLQARVVSWPLTLPMCSPVSDGAAAVVLCTESALGRFNRKRAVKVCAAVLGSSANRGQQDTKRHICALAAAKAYSEAGIGPADVSLAEVHDATAFAEIQQCENLGFCEPGQGGWMAERGETRLGGRLPINTSGGLESKGHPIGATGLAQIAELVIQMRGEAGPRQVYNPRFAVAENGGGFYGIEEAAACVTILGK